MADREHDVAPQVLHKPLERAEEMAALTNHIRGHRMARGGVEAAVWDLDAKRACAPAPVVEANRWCAAGDSERRVVGDPRHSG